MKRWVNQLQIVVMKNETTFHRRHASNMYKFILKHLFAVLMIELVDCFSFVCKTVIAADIKKPAAAARDRNRFISAAQIVTVVV